jgi:hypothetical protein
VGRARRCRVPDRGGLGSDPAGAVRAGGASAAGPAGLPLRPARGTPRLSPSASARRPRRCATRQQDATSPRPPTSDGAWALGATLVRSADRSAG